MASWPWLCLVGAAAAACPKEQPSPPAAPAPAPGGDQRCRQDGDCAPKPTTPRRTLAQVNATRCEVDADCGMITQQCQSGCSGEPVSLRSPLLAAFRAQLEAADPCCRQGAQCPVTRCAQLAIHPRCDDGRCLLSQEPRPPPPAPGGVKLTLPITKPWTDTGLTVKAGDTICIQVSGTVTYADPADQSRVDANGSHAEPGGCTLVVRDPKVPAHSVIGNVAAASSLDGKGFFVGTSFRGQVPIAGTSQKTGRLWLGFNDGAVSCDRSGVDGWGFSGDNRGTFGVTVRIPCGKP